MHVKSGVKHKESPVERGPSQPLTLASNTVKPVIAAKE